MNRRRLSEVAVVVALATLGGACSKSADTQSLTAQDYADNEAVPTTAVRQGALPTTTTTTEAPLAAARGGVDATLASMVSQLAADPALLSSLASLQNLDLAALFGVDPASLEQLGLDGSGVQDLGALVLGSGDKTLADLAAGQIDTDALNQLAALAGQIDAAAIAAVDGLNQQVIGAIVAAVAGIDPNLLGSLTTLLAAVDPGGLGVLAADPATAGVLAVFSSAALQANPALSTAANQRFAADPQVGPVLANLNSIGSTIAPATAAQLTAVGSRLTPQALVSLTRLVTMLNDPEVQGLLARVNG